eukprot:COSAG02_NODE_51693_length_312_cov_0.976526_2_plen_40_part_01
MRDGEYGAKLGLVSETHARATFAKGTHALYHASVRFRQVR